MVGWAGGWITVSKHTLGLYWFELNWMKWDRAPYNFFYGWVGSWLNSLFETENKAISASVEIKVELRLRLRLAKKEKTLIKVHPNYKQGGQEDDRCNGFIFNFRHFDYSSPPMFPIDNFTSCLLSEGLTMQTMDLYPPFVSHCIACSNLCFQVFQWSRNPPINCQLLKIIQVIFFTYYNLKHPKYLRGN